MEQNNNNIEPDNGFKQEAKQELTPQQLQKRKKIVVFPLMFLLFVGALWLIFFSVGGDDTVQMSGFNPDIPMPKEESMVDDKRDAYIQEEMLNREKDKMRSLQEFAFLLGEQQQQENLATISPQMEYGNGTGANSGVRRTTSGTAAINSSAYAYQDVGRQLSSFYDKRENERTNADAAESDLQSRIHQLEERLAAEQERKSVEEEQLTLIERSYEIAARYMTAPGIGQTSEPKTSADITIVATGNKIKPQPVSQVNHSVVSLLSAPVSDSAFIEDFSKERNWGFLNVTASEQLRNKNSISACIYKTVTVTDGQQVQLRLLEAMQVGSYLIPRNTVLSGAARITGERLSITVSSVQHEGNIFPVDMSVYDLDGNRGLSVPGSEEITAAKEITATMGSQMGSSITITNDAKSQLLADLGRSAIQGTSQYLSKKMRTVKVTLKAGHQVLLLPPSQ